jgi:hypothetical protein
VANANLSGGDAGGIADDGAGRRRTCQSFCGAMSHPNCTPYSPLDLERAVKAQLLDDASLERGDTPGGRLAVGTVKLLSLGTTAWRGCLSDFQPMLLRRRAAAGRMLVPRYCTSLPLQSRRAVLTCGAATRRAARHRGRPGQARTEPLLPLVKDALAVRRRLLGANARRRADAVRRGVCVQPRGARVLHDLPKRGHETE